MRSHSAVVLLLLLAFSCTPALAGGKRNRLTRAEHNSAARSVDARFDAPIRVQAVGGQAVGGPAPSRDPYAGRYPKFYGGFHSRELQNIGVPSGDVGLRGNGFSMFPW